MWPARCEQPFAIKVVSVEESAVPEILSDVIWSKYMTESSLRVCQVRVRHI